MVIDVRKRWSAKLRRRANAWRVFVRGEDVTFRCFFVDVRRRVVGLLVRDDQGVPVVLLDGRPVRAFVKLRRGQLRMVKVKEGRERG